MKPLLREIWRSDRRGFLTILGWNILVSLLGGIGIVMLIPLLNQLEIGSGGYLPGFLLALPYGWRVAALLSAYVALVTVKALLSRALSIRESEFIENTSLRLRDELYAAVSGASWESLTASKDTDTISLFTSQCGQVSAGISEVIHLLASLVSAGIQLGIALWMSAPVTLLVCLLGACMLAVFKPLRKKSRDYGDEMIRIGREFYAELQNQLSSVKEVRAYGVEREHAEIFGRINRSFVDARMRYVRLSATPGVVYSVAAALLIAAVYLVCTLGMRVETDRLVVLAFGAFRHAEERRMVWGAFRRLHYPAKFLLAPRLWPYTRRGSRFKGLKRLAGRLLYAAAHSAEGFFDSRITSPEPLIPDEQLPCYLAAADVVFIQRTDILNSGNVPLALSFGRVVTGPDSGNIGGLLAETGNPAFDPADPRSVDIALERAARLSATDQGARNRAYAQEHFGIGRIAAMYGGLYERLYDGKRQ